MFSAVFVFCLGLAVVKQTPATTSQSVMLFPFDYTKKSSTLASHGNHLFKITVDEMTKLGLNPVMARATFSETSSLIGCTNLSQECLEKIARILKATRLLYGKMEYTDNAEKTIRTSLSYFDINNRLQSQYLEYQADDDVTAQTMLIERLQSFFVEKKNSVASIQINLPNTNSQAKQLQSIDMSPVPKSNTVVRPVSWVTFALGTAGLLVGTLIQSTAKHTDTMQNHTAATLLVTSGAAFFVGGGLVLGDVTFSSHNSVAVDK